MEMLRRRYNALDQNARDAVRFFVLLAVTMLASSGYAFLEGASTSVITVIAASMPVLILAVSLTSLRFLFAGSPVWAGRLFLIGLGVSLFGLAATVDGLGVALGVLFFVTSMYLSMLLFSGRLVGDSPISSFAIAVLLMLADAFIPWGRAALSALGVQISTAIALMVLALYAWFVVRNFTRIPLRAKLIMGSLALTIVPLSVSGFLISRTTEKLLIQRADEFLTTASNQVATELDTFLLANLDSVRVEAQIGAMVELLEQPDPSASSREMQVVQEILVALQKKDPVYITSYGLMDRTGRSIVDTMPEEVGVDKSQRPYFVNAVETGLPYVSPVTYSPVTGRASLYFSAPVRSRTGKILGVLRIRYNADVLQQIISRAGRAGGEESFAMLVSEQNVLLANSTNPEWVYKLIAPLDEATMQQYRSNNWLPASLSDDLLLGIPALAEGLQGSSDVLRGEFHPEAISAELTEEEMSSVHSERVAITRLRHLPWYVAVGKPESILFAPIENQARSALIFGVLVAAAGIVFSVWLTAFLTRPIAALTDVTGRMAGGDLSARAPVASADEIGLLAGSFNSMADQLHGLVNSLEQRVADRTQALITSASVSRKLSTLLDEDALVRAVVDQLQEAFHYYHVHIYLFDDQGEVLVMRGGSGEAGQKMLENRHHIPRGKGLVGRAAELVAPVLVDDTAQDPGWLPNPLLPETRAELAVPIVIGESVLGVLDVQQNVVGGLSQADISLLESIASQFAVALQNARVYAITQRRANREALKRSIAQHIQQATTPEEAMQVAVREVGRVLGTPYTAVRLYAPDGTPEKTAQAER